MDAFENQLLTQPSVAPVAPETLEMLGRKAASLFLEKGIPLNDGIRQLVADQPNLNNEHVRRVVEFANTTAFQQMFQSGNDKNVHFDVADPGVVLRDMKDGGSPAHAGKTLSEDGGKKDFVAPPVQENDGIGDAALTQLFAGGQSTTNSAPLDKIASGEEMMEVPHASHANPVDDVFDSYVNLRAARDELVARQGTAETMLKTAQEDLYQAIKGEVLRHGGAGLGGVMGALEKVASQDKIAEVLPGMVRRLMGDGVHPHTLERSMTKVAGVVVNRTHPLVTAWELLEKSAEEKAICDLAIQEANRSIEEQQKFLRSVH